MATTFETRAIELGRAYGASCADSDAEDRPRTRANLTESPNNTVHLDLDEIVRNDEMFVAVSDMRRVGLAVIALDAARDAWSGEAAEEPSPTRITHDQLCAAAEAAAKEGPLGSACDPSAVLSALEECEGLEREDGDEEIVARVYGDVMAAREADETATLLCDCEQVTGQPCGCRGGSVADLVTVEYMPRQHRASHEAAGNRGTYPHNGASHVRCSRACADSILETEDGWATIVPE